jgi:hypothetical protein
MRAKGHCGQWKLNGGALFFPQDVSEVNNQLLSNVLPLRPSDSQTIIVHERVGDLPKIWDLEVSPTRLKVALEFLVKNNPLYRDVTIDSKPLDMDEIVTCYGDEGIKKNIELYAQFKKPKSKEFLILQSLNKIGHPTADQTISAAVKLAEQVDVRTWLRANLECLGSGQQLSEMDRSYTTVTDFSKLFCGEAFTITQDPPLLFMYFNSHEYSCYIFDPQPCGPTGALCRKRNSGSGTLLAFKTVAEAITFGSRRFKSNMAEVAFMLREKSKKNDADLSNAVVQLCNDMLHNFGEQETREQSAQVLNEVCQLCDDTGSLVPTVLEAASIHVALGALKENELEKETDSGYRENGDDIVARILFGEQQQNMKTRVFKAVCQLCDDMEDNDGVSGSFVPAVLEAATVQVALGAIKENEVETDSRYRLNRENGDGIVAMMLTDDDAHSMVALNNDQMESNLSLVTNSDTRPTANEFTAIERIGGFGDAQSRVVVNSDWWLVPANIARDGQGRLVYPSVRPSYTLPMVTSGTFHQGSCGYGLKHLNTQCTSMSRTAIAYRLIEAAHDWTSLDVDNILRNGDRIHGESYRGFGHPHLQLQELNEEFVVGAFGNQYTFQHQSANSISQEIGGHIGDTVTLIRQTSSCNPQMLTCRSTSVALFRSGNMYGLFDSHAAYDGAAALFEFNSADDRVNYIQTVMFPVLDYGRDSGEIRNQFTLTDVIIRRLNDGEIETVGAAPSHHTREDVNAIDDSDGGSSDDNSSPESVNRSRTSSGTSCDDGSIDANNMSFDEGCHQFSCQAEAETVMMPIDPDPPFINQHIIQLQRKAREPLPSESAKIEELSFVQMFPLGRFGFTHPRRQKITAADYFKQRLLNRDSRFRKNIPFLFYALTEVEKLRALSAVSVCSRITTVDGEPQPFSKDNLHLYLKGIRGTASYWREATSDLFAMIGTLGCPTFFLTLSANDLNWSDLHQALAAASDVLVPDVPTFDWCKRLLEEDPVVAAMHFYQRFLSFKNNFLMSQSQPIIGTIVDMWWRVEFQARGSPHIHSVVWVKDAPDLMSQEGFDFIDSLISCNLPATDDPLCESVKRYQVHKHTATCFKKGAKQCRFGFPMSVCKNTCLLDDADQKKNRGRAYRLKRDAASSMINYYNRDITELWGANHDIQPIGSFKNLAWYIAKYISKAEPEDMRKCMAEALQKVNNGSRYISAITSVINKVFNKREVSAQEAVWRLLGLQMRGSSRVAVWVNTNPPRDRARMLKEKSFFGANLEASFCTNIIDRYMARPVVLENICLAEFAMCYKVVYVKSADEASSSDEDGNVPNDDGSRHTLKTHSLQNKLGKIRQRRRPACLKTPRKTVEKDGDSFFYAKVLAFVPFRVESDLMPDVHSAKAVFVRSRPNMRPLADHVNSEALGPFRTELEAVYRYLATIDENGGYQAAPTVDDIERAVDEIPLTQKSLRNSSHNCTEVICDTQVSAPQDCSTADDCDFDGMVSSLNEQQRLVFETIKRHLRAVINGEQPTPLYEFVTGSGGCGKSYLIKVISALMRRSGVALGCFEGDNSPLVLAAPTGVAALNIGGETLHHALCLPVEKGRKISYTSFGGEKLERLRLLWRTKRYLLIDEISMVSKEMFNIINNRLVALKGCDDVFGGISVLVFGDLLQLQPVNGSWIFRAPQVLWNHFRLSILSSNMRQRDQNFKSLLERLRWGKTTVDDVKVLERRLTCHHDDVDLTSVHRILPTNKLCDAYNSEMTSKLAERVEILANDRYSDPAHYGQNCKSAHVPSDDRKCGGLAKKLTIGVGCKVMLVCNLSVSAGLVNGACGTVEEVSWMGFRRCQLDAAEQPENIAVRFDSAIRRDRCRQDGCVLIQPHDVYYDGNGGAQCIRRQLPLRVAYATTVHKRQVKLVN